MNKFYSKIVGSSFCDGQKLIPNLKPGELLIWEREKDNKYDSNAILLFNQQKQKLGYIPATTSKDLAPGLDDGTIKAMEIKVSEVTGGGNVKSVGCNIHIEIFNDIEPF
jgi:hypothetical protein